MFKVSVFAALLMTLSMVSASSSARTADDRFAEQRKLFVKAESFASKPKSSSYRIYQQQLKGYPLKPYIELKTLVAYPYLSNKDKIDRFLTTYENTPMDRPLRKRWLNYLARKDQQALFMHYYKDIGDSKLACRNLVFQLNRDGLTPKMVQRIESFWLVGKSQPKECDPAFKAWQSAGHRSAEHVWQRLSMAADGGKHTLIPYLKKLLPADQRYLADLWLKVRRAPSFVSRVSHFPGTHQEKEAQILSYGLSRLIWRDRALALKTFATVSKRFRFTPEQEQRIANKFATALVIEDHDKAEQWLERANKLEEDEELFRWHLAHILRHDNWQHAMDIIDMAPEPINEDLTFQYWQARAFEEMNAKPQAEQRFDQLADQRHYYGFLASGQLNRQPTIVDKPLMFSEGDLADVANHPAALRAHEFLKLKRYASARREWRYLQSVLGERQLLMAAVVADSWGWHDRAIFTFADAGYMDDVKRRFPMAYQDILVKKANDNNIDPAWAFAIARRESSFMVDANSSAGARGLMQLLPGTARYLAKKKIKSSSLYNPEQNADYGTRYLRYLMDKMDNNPVFATASYNAGWRRVKDWIPDKGSMPMDVWIETIPYKETRNYVKAVLAYRQIYTAQLGKSSNLFENLASMQVSAGMLR